MNSIFKDLFRLIEDKRPDLAKALQLGLSESELKAYELPLELTELWKWKNGQSPSFYGNFHPKKNEMLIPLEESIEIRKELNELQESGDIPSDNWNSEWVPFTENGGGNYMCLSKQTHEVYYYDKYASSTGLRFNSFEDWLKDVYGGYKEL